MKLFVNGLATGLALLLLTASGGAYPRTVLVENWTNFC
jgi:hypothetical protein